MFVSNRCKYGERAKRTLATADIDLDGHVISGELLTLAGGVGGCGAGSRAHDGRDDSIWCLEAFKERRLVER